MVAKRAVWMVSVVVLLAGCPTTSPHPDGGTPDAGAADAGSGMACVADSDCPDSRLFSCDSSTFRCVPSCKVRTDCSAAHRGTQHAIAACDTALGCQCDEGRCVKALCSADAECAGRVCRDGECVEPPRASDVAACQLWPDFVVGVAGAPVTFSLLAQDAHGLPLVPAGDVTWRAGTGASLASAGATSAAVTLGQGTEAAVEGVRATVGGVSCAAMVRVLGGTPPDDALRATVTDELTGRPVAGVTVLLSTGASGSVAQAVTDEGGLVVLPLAPAQGAPSVSVSAFHPDYGYLTIADYDVSGAATSSRELWLPLRRNANDLTGGYQGTFHDAPATQNAHLGLAGMSAGGSLLELTSGLLLGPTTPASVHVGSAVNQDDVPMPAGSFLQVGASASKTAVSARGLYGVCDVSPVAGLPTAEAAIRAGRCGTRAAWAFTADLPVAELPLEPLVGGAGTVNLSGLLSRSIPLFKAFSSTVVRDARFGLTAAPLTDGGVPDVSSTANFQPLDHTFARPLNVPLGFGFVAKVPALPRLGTGYVDSLLLLGTAQVPGRGLLPLGLGAAVNANADAFTDVQSGLSSQGLVAVRMAPTHHGLEGFPYGLLALALSLEGTTDASLGFAASGLYQRLSPNALPFDVEGARPVVLAGPFLAYPRGGQYNYAPVARPGLLGRQFKFASDPALVGASVLRVTFTDAAARTWTVLMDPARLLTGFRVPLPPRGLADRTFSTAAGDVRSRLLVQALKLDERPVEGNAPEGFNDVVELRAALPDRVMETLQAFSSLDQGRPELRWTSPAQDGQAVPGGQAPRLQVTGFKVGVDGVVAVTFDGCGAQPLLIALDSSQGKGELPVPVPAGCSGRVGLSAELYEGIQGPPLQLAPRVVATRTALLP